MLFGRLWQLRSVIAFTPPVPCRSHQHTPQRLLSLLNSSTSNCNNMFRHCHKHARRLRSAAGSTEKHTQARCLAVSQVFVLHGASKSSVTAIARLLKHQASNCSRVVALLDPDVAGRQSRTVIDACFPGSCWHAFLPVWQATAPRDIRCGSFPVSLVLSLLY